jgi:hypothetical protein
MDILVHTTVKSSYKHSVVCASFIALQALKQYLTSCVNFFFLIKTDQFLQSLFIFIAVNCLGL